MMDTLATFERRIPEYALRIIYPSDKVDSTQLHSLAIDPIFDALHGVM